MIPLQDALPPPELMPDQVYALPELRYPLRLNVAVELLDRNAEGDRGGRPAGCKYWRKPDRQAEYVRFGGWNVTGDVYVRDEDGYLFYQCRSDDMIVSGGYKIPGPEVEHVLDEHPAVAESAVVAAPDATRGFIVKAFVVLKPGRAPAPALVAELQEHVKRELAPYKYPRAVEFVEKLPRTETGKIQRFVLRQSDVIPYDPQT